MPIRISLAALLLACIAFTATKQTPSAKTGNAVVEMTASLYVDREAIKQVLGSDLDGYFVVVEVKLSPKTAEKVKVFRDDFLLRTDRDGERSKPFAPTQIAGRGLVLNRTYEGGGIGAESGGPSFGGLGMGGSGVGNSGSVARNEVSADTSSKGKANPLLAALEEKVLAEKEISEPVSGFLYFPMERKQKVKDLELTYSGPGSKLLVRFR